jgi:hypothetical protein
VLVAVNRHRALALVAATKAVLTVALGIAGAHFLPDRPLIGITAGFLVASIISQLFVLPWIIRRAFDLSWASYGAQFIGRPLLLCVVFGIFAAAGQIAGVDTLATRLLALATSLIGIALATWFLVLDRSEVRWLENLIRTRLPFGKRRLQQL